jgi:predicted transcriptional regulator
VIRCHNKKGCFPNGVRMRELHVITNLTNNINRKIVQFLLKQEKYTLRYCDTIHKAPSTMSWYLSRSREANIVMSVRCNNGRSICKLKNKVLSSILAVTILFGEGWLGTYELAL